MPMRENNGSLSQSQPSSKAAPLFLWIDGETSPGVRCRSMRFRERREMAAVSLSNAPEARGAALAITDGIQSIPEGK